MNLYFSLLLIRGYLSFHNIQIIYTYLFLQENRVGQFFSSRELFKTVQTFTVQSKAQAMSSSGPHGRHLKSSPPSMTYHFSPLPCSHFFQSLNSFLLTIFLLYYRQQTKFIFLKKKKIKNILSKKKSASGRPNF